MWNEIAPTETALLLRGNHQPKVQKRGEPLSRVGVRLEKLQSKVGKPFVELVSQPRTRSKPADEERVLCVDVQM